MLGGGYALSVINKALITYPGSTCLLLRVGGGYSLAPGCQHICCEPSSGQLLTDRINMSIAAEKGLTQPCLEAVPNLGCFSIERDSKAQLGYWVFLQADTW